MTASAKQKLTIFAIALVCAMPLIAALFTYYVWRPTKHMNFGTLLKPAALPAARLTSLDGRAFDFAQLKGKWVLLAVDSSACAAPCEKKLYAMRQLRLAQGKDMDRVARVWLLTDRGRPAASLLSKYAGMRVVRAAGSAVLAALPAPRDPRNHLYVIDPMGNLMMRFPNNPDPSGMLRDLQRLVRPMSFGTR